jgi:hypothetical protein
VGGDGEWSSLNQSINRLSYGLTESVAVVNQ